MKIICQKSELLNGVNIVQKAVPVRSTMTVLECILVDASDGHIRLTANDMELGIETVIEGIVEEKGKIALDAKFFSEIVRKLPDNDIVISTDSSYKTVITCENSKFTIMGRNADEFTPLPYVEKNDVITISQFALKEMIRQTIFSIASSETNKIMTGELIEAWEDKMRMVALDGHRVSYRTVTLNHSYDSRKVIVPGKTLQEISRIMSGEASELVDISISENLILFEMGDTKIVSRLIEGEYFKVQEFITNDYNLKIHVNRKMLLECLERASLLILEKDKKPVVMDIVDNTMELKVRSPIGTMNEPVMIHKEGADLKIAFNPRFFIDALRAIDDEEVTMYMINTKAPCFIRDDTDSYIYLLLPINFNEDEY